MNQEKRITLLGAYGFTARKIAALLNKLGISFSVAGRDMAKLIEIKKTLPAVLEIYFVDILQNNDLDKLILNTDILINCIGPYNVYGEIIVEKSARAGIWYLDICGEQEFIKKSFENISEIAEDKGASIIHSLSFESALVDILAKSYLPKKENWVELSSVYYFERSVPSGGTRLSMQTSKFFPTYTIVDHKLKASEILGFMERVNHPERPNKDIAIFMPYPEVLFFERQYSPSFSGTYLLTSKMDAMFLQAGKKPDMAMEVIMEREGKRKKSGPSEEECKNQYFEIILFGRAIPGTQCSYMLSGNNMYQVTASILVNFLKYAMKIKHLPAGVYSPAEAVNDSMNLLNDILFQNNIVLNLNSEFTKIKSVSPNK